MFLYRMLCPRLSKTSGSFKTIRVVGSPFSVPVVPFSVRHNYTRSVPLVSNIKDASPAIPSYFKRLFANKSLEQTLRESGSDFNHGLGILSQYAVNGDSAWISSQFEGHIDSMNRLMVYLTEQAYSEVLSTGNLIVFW